MDSDMRVFISTMGGKTLEVAVTPKTGVALLKVMLERLDIDEVPPAPWLRLFFEDKKLENGRTLEYYGITNGAALQLVISQYNEYHDCDRFCHSRRST